MTFIAAEDPPDISALALLSVQLYSGNPKPLDLHRRSFDALAAAEWSRFQRYHRPLSLILMDVDRFKSINDRLGHESGDVALKHIAALCIEGKRSSDLVARQAKQSGRDKIVMADTFALTTSHDEWRGAVRVGRRHT